MELDSIVRDARLAVREVEEPHTSERDPLADVSPAICRRPIETLKPLPRACHRATRSGAEVTVRTRHLGDHRLAATSEHEVNVFVGLELVCDELRCDTERLT